MYSSLVVITPVISIFLVHSCAGFCSLYQVELVDVEPKSPPMQIVQKKTLEEGLLVDDAAGQPSPVSILQSPFHDEACTTSESSPGKLTY